MNPIASKFVDTYLRLDVKEEQLFQAEIDTIGIEKGIERERRSIALNMLRKEMPLETIAEVTRLTLVQLQTLQTESN